AAAAAVYRRSIRAADSHPGRRGLSEPVQPTPRAGAQHRDQPAVRGNTRASESRAGAAAVAEPGDVGSDFMRGALVDSHAGPATAGAGRVATVRAEQTATDRQPAERARTQLPSRFDGPPERSVQ